jgi:CHAT domain-containing protein
MSALPTGFLAFALAVGAAAEEPPWKRLLQGDDARQAAELEKRLDELEAAGRFADAAAPAEELQALRQRVQGADHWQAADARRRVETLRKVAALPEGDRRGLVEASRQNAEAEKLHGQAKYEQEEALLRQALAARRKALGEDHPIVAGTLQPLAQVLGDQGRLTEAEPFYRQVLEIRRRALGPDHPWTGSALNNLALNLHYQGRSADAEPFARQALEVVRRNFSDEHSNTLTCRNTVAMTLDGQGLQARSEPLYREVLTLRRKLQGENHLLTALAESNLGLNLVDQGRSADAEPLLRHSLEVYRKERGQEHPQTALALNNLAIALNDQGKLAEAEALHRQALAARRKVLTNDHPATLSSQSNLAYNLRRQGRTAEALALQREVLARRLRLQGEDNLETALAYNNLAYSLSDQGDYAAAQPLFEKALAVRLRLLGEGHPDAAASCSALAVNLDHQRQFTLAEPLHRKAMAVWERLRGPDHPETVRTLNNLALNLNHQGKRREAVRMLEDALVRNLKRGNVAGPLTMTLANNLTTMADDTALLGLAQTAYTALQLRRSLELGPDHPDTALATQNLAAGLDVRGKHAQAEPLHRQALAAYRKTLGDGHPSTALSALNLASTVHALGRWEDAEPLWRAAADQFEAARLRIAAGGLDRGPFAAERSPLPGLAVCRARLGRAAEAWQAAEASLARGLLDDLAARAADPEQRRRRQERAARLEDLDRQIVPLTLKEKPTEAERARLAELSKQRAAEQAEVAREAADLAKQQIWPLERVQKQIPADAALVFWIDQIEPGRPADPAGDHWACVLRQSGPPVWVQLLGSGPKGKWTSDEKNLPQALREELSRPDGDWRDLARRLAAQRLEPLAPHLKAAGDLPAVRRLIAVPAGRMAGVPLEALTDGLQISYAPSGSVFARLQEAHRPLRDAALLAVGDPVFRAADAAKPPTPPEYGLLVTQATPKGNAALAGLRVGDVLLSYGGARLTALGDLKIKPEGDPIPVRVWRDGDVLEKTVKAGPLGAAFHREPARLALAEQREADERLVKARGADFKRLPGTRQEVKALAGLFPRAELLLGSQASEQQLDRLAGDGKLKTFRVLHLATHGLMDPGAASRSALILAQDRLPDPVEQARAGKKVYTGRLTVEALAGWELDADLVTLSACETALGRDGGGEGYLGFAQALFAARARSLVLSLWQVDDAATALLMMRFYEDLLGKRPGLKGPMTRAEALAEAKAWLRDLPRADAERLAARLSGGELRGTVKKLGPIVGPPPPGSDEKPYAHPFYWSAFILLGDPD